MAMTSKYSLIRLTCKDEYTDENAGSQRSDRASLLLLAL